MCEVHIVKTCVGTVPAERNCSAFTVAVFGDDTFSQCLVSIFAFIVIGIAVKEQNYVCVLFDRTGVTQVRQLWSAVTTAAFFSRTGQL